MSCWQRRCGKPSTTSLEKDERSGNEGPNERSPGWTKKRAWGLVLLLALVPLSQHRIHGQILPDPCCPILSAGLGTIADLLRTVIGGPLDEIRSIQDEIN